MNNKPQPAQLLQQSKQKKHVELRWARFNVPLDTVLVILETMFYRSDSATNSVKASKEGG